MYILRIGTIAPFCPLQKYGKTRSRSWEDTAIFDLGVRVCQNRGNRSIASAVLLNKLFDRQPPPVDRPRSFLRAVGPLAAKVPVGQTIADRYRVVAPQIWEDTQPNIVPHCPATPPDEILPYLKLSPYRFHLPEAFGYAQWAKDGASILLLENAPIDAEGELFPAIADAWENASAFRQVYWLWQILSLWRPLSELNVAASLLDPENLSVEGEWVRMLELQPATMAKSLKDLAFVWLKWVDRAREEVAQPIKNICFAMQEPGVDSDEIERSLNALVLQHSAKLPLRLGLAGRTYAGPQRDRNEDSYYPTAEEAQNSDGPIFALLCDGVGGHEGGEVASQMAVQTLTLQLRVFGQEIQKEPEPLSPSAIAEQLAASIRVANNTIAAQNDAQERESQQRMGTTLVMAVLVEQTLAEDSRSRELYLANVGDSRAYWVTKTACRRLTLDDDIATREVRLGRSLYREALARYDAGALTQALGTRDGELLRPKIDRFIFDEDGILLLCSDGISDNDLVERSHADIVPQVLSGELSLEDAARSWVDRANRDNGHDNATLVMTYLRLSPGELKLFSPPATETRTTEVGLPDTEMSESSKNLLYTEGESQTEEPTTVPLSRRRRRPRQEVPPFLLSLVGSFVAFFLAGLVGWLAFSQMRSPSPTPPPPEAIPPAGE